MRRPIQPAGRSGFSLVEVLMAIFILGIGAISIAALFPAGIAQQRRSTDDVLGPIVANNALSIIRAKLRSQDFGAFEDFSDGQAVLPLAPRPTVGGDWTWLRPSIILRAGIEQGSLDIFSHDWTTGTQGNRATEFEGGYPGTGPTLYGIPYNRALYFNPDEPPRILITRRERFYPMASNASSSTAPVRPQYVWDCMFRRFQGRILVAVFVYRANVAGGEPGDFHPVPNQDNPGVPPLPIWVDLAASGSEPWREEPWDVEGDPNVNGPDAWIPGTDTGDEFDIQNDSHVWQVDGQWIIDQNNNIHRVLSGRDDQDRDGPVELVRPVPATPLLPVYFQNGTNGFDDVVTDIWYMPVSATGADGREYRLTPVYATVKEL